MSTILDMVYENGVLRPLVPLDLKEHQRVTVTIGESRAPPHAEEWLDEECMRECALEADDNVSLDEVRRALSKIPGSLAADVIAEREDR